MNITVIGLGRLGAVAAGGLAAAGHEVTGLDVDERRVSALREGRIPFYEPGLEECLTVAVDRGNLRFLRTSDFSGCLGDVALIAAGTPASANGAADLGQVRDALAWVKGLGPRNLALVMKSTVPPGSGVELLRQDLNGLDIEYVANPEFLREGRALHDWQFPDRIVLGAEPGADKSLDAVREMYSGIKSPFLVTDITSAEMIKYASNAFLATRISFINEISIICERLGADVTEVARGMGFDKRIGPHFLEAGVGFGGSCFPKDVKALANMAQTHGMHPQLLNAVMEINVFQRRQITLKAREMLGGSVNGRTLAILGLAFKQNTDDTRESPSLTVARSLLNQGAAVKAYDPVAMDNASQELPAIQMCESPYEAAEGSDALLALTPWNEFKHLDMRRIHGSMANPVFIDGRNMYNPAELRNIGFVYRGVGRGYNGEG